MQKYVVEGGGGADNQTTHLGTATCFEREADNPLKDFEIQIEAIYVLPCRCTALSPIV